MTVLVIVPGSFAPTVLYDDWVADLAKNGVRSVVVDLPTVGPREGPARTMTDDAEAITRVVSRLLDDGEEVVLLTHSYGGIPGSQSLETLSHKAREAQGKTGVNKIIYMTSVILPVGTSNLEAFGDKLPDAIRIDGDTMYMDTKTIGVLTFSDLPDDEAFAWASKMSSHSLPSFQEKLRYAGYNDVEVHYVLCENDKIIPPEFQGSMVELVKASSGREPTVHRIQADHAPTISKKDEMTALVRSIVG